MSRKPFYPVGSRSPFNARVDTEKKEIIEANLKRLGVKSLTEWIDMHMERDIKEKRLKKEKE